MLGLLELFTLPLDDAVLGLVSPKSHNRDKLCSRSEILDGRWENVTLERAPYNPWKHYVGSFNKNVLKPCGVSSDYEQPWSWNEWIPRGAALMSSSSMTGSCAFDLWSKENFCKTAEMLQIAQNFSETIAIVGDSLSWEHFVTLVMSLGNRVDYYGQFISRREGKSIEQMTCNDTVRIVYRRSDYLEHLPDVLKSSFPSTVVINTGSHFLPAVDDFIRRLNSTIDQLEHWTQSCKESRKTCWLIVRTTVPGHPHCGAYNDPDNEMEEMEDLISNKSNYGSAKELNFNWFNFKQRNKLMLDMFNVSNLNYSVIDAYEINIRRPDNHKYPDCLHNCVPGKTDVYNRLLLHSLKKKLRQIATK